MGKRHRAHDPTSPTDFLNSTNPPPAAPAHTLICKSVNDSNADGKHANERSTTGGAKPQGLSSVDKPKRSKIEKQRTVEKTGNFEAATDDMPSNGVNTGVDSLLKHASEGRSVDLDGQMWKKNEVKRKAEDIDSNKCDGIDGSKSLKRKKKKALADEGSSKNLNVECEDRVTGQSFNLPPSSGQVMSSIEKGTPSGLEVYWKLSATDSAVREVASMTLVRELRAAQEVYEARGDDSQKGGDQVFLGAAMESDGLEECAPGVRYALRRLIRGVASSHESARQGFALALTMVLGVLHSVKGAAIMQIIEKNLELTSSVKGQDAREGLLGRLFAYGAIVRSKIFFSDAHGFDKDLLKEITEQLLALAKRKSFLREPAVSVLLELADQVRTDLLETSICAASAFREWIKVGPESGGADVLFLAVKLWQKLPTTISKACPFLPDSRNTSQLFDTDHISTILPYLEEASFCHPRVHSIWPLLFQILLSDDANKDAMTTKKKKKQRKGNNCAMACAPQKDALARFWSAVLDGRLLTSSHARKHLALNLLMLVLPTLPTEFINIVLSNALVRCLLDVLASKDTLLFKCAQTCLHELCKWAGTEDKRIMGVVVSLQQASFGKFDALSKTFTIKSLIGKLTSQGIESMIYELEAMFCKGIAATNVKADANLLQNSLDNNEEMLKTDGGEGTSSEKANAVAEKKIVVNNSWILNLIGTLCKQAQLDFAKKATLQTEVGKFLLCQAVFDSAAFGKLGPPMQEAIKWPLLPIPALLKQRVISHLQSLLAENQQLLMAQKLNKKRSGEVDKGINEVEDLGVCLFRSYRELQQLLAITVTGKQSKEDTKILSKLTTAISEVSSTMQAVDGEKREKLRTMHSLLVQVVLQSWLDSGWDVDIASELLISCKHLFGDFLSLDLGDMEEGLSESPRAIEVIVDLVVSILARSSAPLRTAAEQVFRSLTSDITASSLRGMLQVIKKQPLAARHKVNDLMDSEGKDDDDDPLGLEEDESGDDEDNLLDLDRREDNLEDLPLTNADSMQAKDTIQKLKIIDKSTGSSKKAKSETDKRAPQKDLQDGSDLDDSDLSDLDDDAMFRMDAHLAQIFKHKKNDMANSSGEGKGADAQLLQLKFRILGLLETLLQKCSTSPLVLVLVPSLLQAFVVASGTGSSQLADRVASILQNKVFKAKHYVKATDANLSTVKNILDRTWRLASRSANKKVGNLAQACWIWMLKVSHGSFSSEVDREPLEVVAAAIEDFFNHKKCRLSASFFVDTFTRQPWTGRLVIDRLIEKCIAARSEFLQCEAIRLAALVLNPNSGILKDPAASPDAGWKRLAELLLPYLERIESMLVTVFEKPFKKASKQAEAVRFCMVVCEALPLIYRQRSLAETMNIKQVLSAVKSFEAPEKGKLRSLVSKFQQSLEAALAASSCLRETVKAGDDTVASQPPESVGTLKKKKKPKLNI